MGSHSDIMLKVKGSPVSSSRQLRLGIPEVSCSEVNASLFYEASHLGEQLARTGLYLPMTMCEISRGLLGCKMGALSLITFAKGEWRAMVTRTDPCL